MVETQPDWVESSVAFREGLETYIENVDPYFISIAHAADEFPLEELEIIHCRGHPPIHKIDSETARNLNQANHTTVVGKDFQFWFVEDPDPVSPYSLTLYASPKATDSPLDLDDGLERFYRMLRNGESYSAPPGW